MKVYVLKKINRTTGYSEVDAIYFNKREAQAEAKFLNTIDALYDYIVEGQSLTAWLIIFIICVIITIYRIFVLQ